MTIGERLLKLHDEYANREALSEFHGERVEARSVEAIAADYEATLRELLA